MKLNLRLISSLIFLQTSSAWAIVNGQKSVVGDLFSQSTVALSLRASFDGVSYCSAVVIRQDTLITAAHCVEDGLPVVLLGLLVQKKSELSPSAAAVEVEKIYHNKKYELSTGQDKHREDLAIIHLKKNLPKNYEPVDMDLEGKKVSGDLRITGFGSQSSSGMRRDLFVNSGASENIELREKSVKVSSYDNEVIKISQPEGGLCFGDSGGGSFSEDSLKSGKPLLLAININAGSDDGPSCATVAFALRLSSKKGWINEQLEKIQAQRKPQSVDTEEIKRLRGK